MNKQQQEAMEALADVNLGDDYLAKEFCRASGLDYVSGKSAYQLWHTCEDGYPLAVLVENLELLDGKELRLLACDFAEHVLHIYEAKHPKDSRPRKAIEVARLFAAGKATDEDLQRVRNAAKAAGTAADAADAAAWAAAYAADAATASAAAYAAASASRAAEEAWQADQVRARVSWSSVRAALKAMP